MWFYYFIISGHESCRNCPKDLYAFGYTFSHHQGLFHFYKILTEYMDLIAYMSRDRVFVKENLTITGDTNIMRHNFSLFFLQTYIDKLYSVYVSLYEKYIVWISIYNK